jgi:hypothetical protein
MLTNQLFEQHVTVRKGQKEQSNINRLLAAAVVSRQFCSLLLSDPVRAIAAGYAGEQFSLTEDEYELVLFAHGSTLPEFAKHLCEHLPASKPATSFALSEAYQLRL